jgi:hypothetical protein
LLCLEDSGHGHSSSREFCESLLDCVRACRKSLREDTCGKKRFFSEKLRHGLPNVSQTSRRSGFVVKGKVALVQAPASTLNRGETNSRFSKNSRKFPMHRFVSLPLQGEELHHADFLMFLHLACYLSMSWTGIPESRLVSRMERGHYFLQRRDWNISWIMRLFANQRS